MNANGHQEREYKSCLEQSDNNPECHRRLWKYINSKYEKKNDKVKEIVDEKNACNRIIASKIMKKDILKWIYNEKQMQKICNLIE